MATQAEIDALTQRLVADTAAITNLPAPGATVDITALTAQVDALEAAITAKASG